MSTAASVSGSPRLGDRLALELTGDGPAADVGPAPRVVRSVPHAPRIAATGHAGVTSTQGAAWSRPSPKLWMLRVTEVAVLAVVAAVVAVLAASKQRGVILAVALGCVVVLVAVAIVFARRRFRAWGYLERDEDLLVRRGVLVQRLTVVPYGRMQLVEVTAGVLERLYGLSTVKLHTAAASSDARIPGLEPEEAARLRDRLAALGEARAAGL
jgi:membrane protein YdbS with pleckstrin-like domain